MSLFIIAFIVVVAAFAFWIGRNLNYEGYWLNNRRTTLFLLVSTIVATQVGAGTTLGIVASTAESGSGYGLVAVVTTVAGFLLIPFFIPAVLRIAQRSGEFTLTGLFRFHFGPVTGLVASLVTVAGYLCLLAGQLVAGAALLESLTTLNWNEAILLSGVTVVIYSAFAGLKGDFLTDGFLFVFMTILLILTLIVLAGLYRDIPDLIVRIPAEIWSPVRFGGYSYLIGGLTIGILLPLISLEMWLRVFAADEKRIAKSAFRWSALLVAPFYVVPMMAGAVAPIILGPIEGSQTVLVEVLAIKLPQPVMAMVYLGLVATIISTTNTLQLVLGAVVHRDLIPHRRENVTSSRVVAAVVGLTASLAAFFVKDIVDLVLAGAFVIILMGPLFLDLVMRSKIEPSYTPDWITAGALIIGVVVTCFGYPLIGVGAVIAGFVVVGMIVIVLRVMKPLT